MLSTNRLTRYGPNVALNHFPRMQQSTPTHTLPFHTPTRPVGPANLSSFRWLRSVKVNTATRLLGWRHPARKPQRRLSHASLLKYHSSLGQGNHIERLTEKSARRR